MTEFLKPRLVGPRFDDGTIPLEMLGDLAVLQELVVEVAKWKYLETNPHRSRSPKGFTDRASLTLTGIKRSSAIPLIDLRFHIPHDNSDPQLENMPEPFEYYFEQALDAIIDAISAAETDTLTQAHLPDKCLEYFDRFGRSLRDDESIELSSPTRQKPARLTKGTRRKLVLASRIREISEEVYIRGYIPEADQRRMSFEVQLLEGRRIQSSMQSQHLQVVLEVFNDYRDDRKAWIRGIGKYDRQGNLVRLESIEDIVALDPLDVSARLDEFRTMQDGWMDGTGNAPESAGLDWLSDSFERLFSDDLPLPHLFPTPDGGIEAEWSLGERAVIFEIDLNSHRGHWLSFDKQSDNADGEDGRTLDLNDPTCWTWFANEIRRMSAGLE